MFLLYLMFHGWVGGGGGKGGLGEKIGKNFCVITLVVFDVSSLYILSPRQWPRITSGAPFS